ncbi:sarcosine oxidase subunit gamma [Pseudaestuariivita sp.]|uniref:sarcosine oxidase subunit gamma n=1 Tax=Pseudaestuariivita sp. TaxID=2211669 RepID=UPI0040599F73
MIDLTPLSPLAGQDPVSIGDVTLAEVDLGPLTLVLPFKGKAGAVGDALGQSLPAPLKSVNHGKGSIIWFGKDGFLVTGETVADAVSEHAAVTDQSDGWVAVTLSGAGAEDVLARLVPIDLRVAAFPEGATTRGEVMHVAASITRTGAEEFTILAFRSMAETLWHELEAAMQKVAGRASL